MNALQTNTPDASRELLLLRHGKSAWNTPAASDFERPLAPRGRKQAPRLGEWLLARALVPDRIVSSPAERARQTTLAVSHALGLGAEAIHFDERIYDASEQALLAVLSGAPEVERVMLVGHNPGLDALLEHLCGPALPRTAQGKLLTTAALARVAMPTDWTRLTARCATLLDLVRPRDLKK